MCQFVCIMMPQCCDTYASSSYSISLFGVTLRALILNYVVAVGAYCEESFIIHLRVPHGALRLFFSVFPVFTTR